MGRRQITTTITMLVLCGLVVIGAVWGWQSLFAEVPDDTSTAEAPSAECTSERLGAGERLRSSQVRVSVFNGGTEAGLAESTSEALPRRGFRVGKVGNAPSDVDVDRAVVRSTRRSDPAARLVARQFRERVRVRVSDDDLGPGIDVIVGNDFRRLGPAARSLRIREPQEVCISAAGN